MARIDGYLAVPITAPGPGYVKPGDMSDRCKGGSNGEGNAQQSGPCPYDSKDEGYGTGD